MKILARPITHNATNDVIVSNVVKDNRFTVIVIKMDLTVTKIVTITAQ